MVKSPAKIWEEYISTSTDEKRKIWQGLVKDFLHKDTPPPYILAISLLLDVKDEVKDNINSVLERTRRVLKNKRLDWLTRDAGIDLLRVNAYKETNPKGHLSTIDTLYGILNDKKEIIELRKSAGYALMKLGSKWLTRRIIAEEELINWLEAKRKEVGSYESRTEDLEDVIERWEVMLRGTNDERFLGAILLGLMDKYSLLNAKKLFGLLKEIRKINDELITKWHSIVLPRIEKISKQLSEEDVEDVAGEVGFEELSKLDFDYKKVLFESLKESALKHSERGERHKG